MNLLNDKETSKAINELTDYAHKWTGIPKDRFITALSIKAEGNGFVIITPSLAIDGEEISE